MYNVDMERVTVTREELYDQVWSTPVTKVAASYGISGVALAKICRKLNVPRPGLGYWARLAAGQRLQRPELPRAPQGVPLQVTFDRRPPGASDRHPEAPVVEVPKRLATPHSAVVWLENEIDRSSKEDKYGRLFIGPDFSPEFCVRKPHVKRALLLLDTLFKTLESRGHRVEVKAGTGQASWHDLAVHLGQDVVEIEVEEKLARRPHVITSEERKAKERWPATQILKWDWYPSGDLALRLSRSHYKYTGQKCWYDSKRRRLETGLGMMVLGLEAYAGFKRCEGEASEQREQEFRRRERQRLRGEHLAWYRRWLWEDLHRMVAAWSTASDIRRFLAEYATRVPEPTRSQCEEDWLAAANAHADRLDPFKDVEAIAKELEPSDEALANLLAEATKKGQAHG